MLCGELGIARCRRDEHVLLTERDSVLKMAETFLLSIFGASPSLARGLSLRANFSWTFVGSTARERRGSGTWLDQDSGDPERGGDPCVNRGS